MKCDESIIDTWTLHLPHWRSVISCTQYGCPDGLCIINYVTARGLYTMQYFIPVQPVLDCCLIAIYVVNQKLVLLYKKKKNYNETMLE